MVRIRFRGRHSAPPLFVALFLLGAVAGCQAPGQEEPLSSPSGGARLADAAGPSVGDADEFLIVDCLLPAQVKRLGRQVTYLAARRAMRTSAIECAVRGGEYVAYDRANIDTALRVWLEPANAGDAEAQNYVGEIYERGFGRQPDYAMAAEWYRRAAEQGFAPAQINLGQLYEQGLGVPQDQLAAINWYRRASGFEEAGLSFVVSADVATEMRDLRESVMLRDDDARRLREQIESLQQQIAKLESERRRAEAASAAPAPAPDAEAGAAVEEIEQARAELRAERAAVEQQRQVAIETAAELERMEGALEARRERLAIKEQEVQQQRAQGADDTEALAEVESLLADLRERQIEYDRRTEELAAREAEIAERDREVAARQAEIAALEAEIGKREKTIEAKEGELSDLDRQIAELRQTFEEQREQLAAISRKQTVSLAGPEIELIDPRWPSEQTRGKPVIWTRADIKQRPIIGRVDAPAGLLSLLVNDQSLTAGDNNTFQYNVPIGSNGTEVSIVAVDRQGKRAAMEFVMAPETKVAALKAVVPEAGVEPEAPPLPPIDFGNYHALVIGNNDYQHLPKLETAINDAEAVGKLLAKKYGFEVQILRDANRYQILSALNALRSRLTENDNLLIYYAGHGELDRVNQRGHWLPVDAERDSDANWISNISVTDLLNAMNAKHILVVADSCYSGALTRAVLTKLESGISGEQRLAWLKATAKKRARLALTSGGLSPVLDGGGGEHSVFARAFIETLQANPGLLEGQDLYQEIADRVAFFAEQVRFEQLPQYAPIRHTGHEAGDFFFVPRVEPTRRAGLSSLSRPRSDWRPLARALLQGPHLDPPIDPAHRVVGIS